MINESDNRRSTPTLPSLRSARINAGTKTEDNAPSAKTLRKELGTRNATKKASDKTPTPKNCIVKISRK